MTELKLSLPAAKKQFMSNGTLMNTTLVNNKFRFNQYVKDFIQTFRSDNIYDKVAKLVITNQQEEHIGKSVLLTFALRSQNGKETSFAFIINLLTFEQTKAKFKRDKSMYG